jgi:hypothetical protein
MLMAQMIVFQKSGFMHYQVVARINWHKYFDAAKLRNTSV